MKSYTGLTVRYLQMQGKRTVVTLIGIILSVALITSIGIIGQSIKSTQIAQEREYGDYHARFEDINLEQLTVLANHLKLEKPGTTLTVGGYDIPNSGIMLLLSGWDVQGLDTFNITLTAGRLPTTPNEIALEEWILDELPFKAGLGDTIKLPFDHTFKDEKGYYQTIKGEGEFLITGLLEENIARVTRRSLGLLTLEGAAALLPPERHLYTAFASVKEGFPIRETLLEIHEDLEIPSDKLDFNIGLLNALGESEKPNWALIFMALVVIIATVAAIYNILHISVMERIRQFGMFRSIGATPAQIRKIVFGEALILSLIGIPLGFLTGFLITWILVSSLSILKVSITVISVPFWPSVGVVLVSLTAILLSTFSPARLAGKVSPLEAIKVNAGIVKDHTQRQRRWHSLIQKTTGITGKLAYQNLWRNRKRLFVTVFSISIGVILFIVFGFFVKSADPGSMLEAMLAGDYVLEMGVLSVPGFSEADYLKVAQLPGVEEVKAFQRGVGRILLSEEEITPEYREEFLTGPYGIKKDETLDKYPIHVEVLGYANEILQSMDSELLAGTLDIEQGDVPEVWIVDQRTATGSFRSGLQVGDLIELIYYYQVDGDMIEKTITVQVAGFVYDIPIPMNFRIHGLRMITNKSTYQQIFDFTGYFQLVVNLQSGADTQLIESSLKQIAKNVPQSTFISFKEEMKIVEDQKRQIMYLIYGLIGVICLIGTFTIVNTLSTNLILRIREFGTMRAVGMTHMQLKKMVQLEGVFYGVLSALWGSIGGTGFAYVLYLLLKSEMTYLTWSIPWLSILFAWLGCIGIGLLATYAPLKRISKMTTIDALKTIE